MTATPDDASIPVHPRLKVDEPFTARQNPPNLTVTDFWSWAGSDLLGNTLRGILAEFIVGTALECIPSDRARVEWDPHDLTVEGVKVEVKSTATVQSWGEMKVNSTSFKINETRKWDPDSRTYIDPAKRHADIYVFCLFSPAEGQNPNPLDLDQWRFYVVTTEVRKSTFGSQKAVALSTLKSRAQPRECGFGELKDTFSAVATDLIQK